MTKSLSHVRHGAGSVRPYVHGHLGLWDMVKAAFDAVEIERHEFSANSFHIEAQIGDSMIALETGDPPHPEGAAGEIYVYVPDVDVAFRKALERGAVSIAEPEDKPYNERVAGVRDAFGNKWWISTYQE
jgi:PhnB protein